ncbi:hypothetical protein [Bacillus solitudinis]|uniref:hypothetical protein n=1 Tax=Bacillus solitudinis TaxID=2014074 RepID=UPI000C23B289|nr:hypothetical protein [Bacillus solitudinis]
MEAEQVQKSRPAWLKWTVRVILSYVTLLAIILAITIIVILITLSFTVIDGLSESRTLNQLSQEYLIPISDFSWKIFTWLVPGL